MSITYTGRDNEEQDPNVITRDSHPFLTTAMHGFGHEIIEIEVRPDAGFALEGDETTPPGVEIIVSQVTGPPTWYMDLGSMKELECQSLIDNLTEALARAREQALARGWKPAENG